jgi:curved DNA-binding protein
MDYYEEFGISRTATTEEIRQAHKRLARLLHPDRLQEDDLQHLAECQMKRLNVIYGVLVDPEKRSEYDRLLAKPLVEKVAPGPRSSLSRYAAWVMVA